MFKGTSSVHTHTDLFIPRRHYVLHVDVTGEKCHNAVGNHRRHLQKQVAVVTNHSWKTEKRKNNVFIFTNNNMWRKIHNRNNNKDRNKQQICFLWWSSCANKLFPLTEVFSGLKLWAQGHLIVSPANNLHKKQETGTKTIELLELIKVF